MKTKLLLIAIICFVLGFTIVKYVLHNPCTKLRIVNQSDSAVTVWITLGATEGCLQHANQIPYVTDTIGGLVGSFILPAGDSTIDYSPIGLGFNGNLSFNTQPINCASEQFPTGVNIFEFIINNGFQAGNPQNTVDISCVAGENCMLKAYLSGGSVWNAGPTVPSVDSIYNGEIGLNKGKVGVYPFGCDTCTGAKTPPACDSTSVDKQTQSICNVQRNAKGSGGGLVKVVYLGKAYKVL